MHLQYNHTQRLCLVPTQTHSTKPISHNKHSQHHQIHHIPTQPPHAGVGGYGQDNAYPPSSYPQVVDPNFQQHQPSVQYGHPQYYNSDSSNNPPASNPQYLTPEPPSNYPTYPIPSSSHHTEAAVSSSSSQPLLPTIPALQPAAKGSQQEQTNAPAPKEQEEEQLLIEL